VSLEYENPNGTYNLAPVLTDIQNCNLAQVSWVTPDVKWSDHPGSGDNIGLGPDYVSNIIDAIGNSKQNSGGACDYWKADPTVILIIWDDWGGWYDHVPTSVGAGYPDSGGSGKQYVFGFRVPLLVVSSYTLARTVSAPLPVSRPIRRPLNLPTTSAAF
jgi:phospholipase C